MGFPGGSSGEESNWNAGDPDSILESGGSPEEGIGYPVQYSWASLVEMVQKLPAVWETWDGKIPWRREHLSTHFSTLAWSISTDRGAWLQTWGHRVRHTWATKHSTAPHPTYGLVIRAKRVADPAARGLQPARLLCPRDSPGEKTGMGCYFLLQRTFPTQGSNPGLLHGRQILLPSEAPGKFIFNTMPCIIVSTLCVCVCVC